MGIDNSADLAREEERISKKKAIELFKKGILNSLPIGKFSTLQAIHNLRVLIKCLSPHLMRLSKSM